MEKNISPFTKSIVAGIILAIIFGYMFSVTKYYHRKGFEISLDAFNNKSSNEREFINRKEEFNFKVGAIVGALTTGFFMFVYYDEKRKRGFKKILKIKDNSASH